MGLIKKYKILEVCPYSAGICGVFNRVLTESKALTEMNNEVRIFSSNKTKGSKEKALSDEVVDGITIKRFPAIKLGGESFMDWGYSKAAIEYCPDIIIVHNYRHRHTTKALKIKRALAKQGNICKVVLVTHAPFVEDNTTRSKISSLVVDFYDKFIGPRKLKQFDAIVNISQWEVPYLFNLGVDINKLYHIPNCLPDEYFATVPEESINKSVLFLGRVAPIKNIEFIYELAKIMPDYNFSILGRIDEDYMTELSIKYFYPPKNISYYPPIYELDKKIKAIDTHKYFILPSLREALPSSLIEACGRGRTAICTDTQGAREIIQDGVTGYICKNNTPEEAREYILLNEQKPLDSEKITFETFKSYSIKILKEKYEEIFRNLMNTDNNKDRKI